VILLFFRHPGEGLDSVRRYCWIPAFAGMTGGVAALLLLPAALLLAAFAPGPTAQEIADRMIAAHGGAVWLNPKTLELEGRATFWRDGPEPSAVADDYRMWRVFDPGRQAAHAAEGKVRIDAKAKGRLLFQAGFDGAVTWNERGIVPEAEANAFWASNFGFGIVRQIGAPGFKLERLADGNVEGHLVHTLRLTDPGGQATLFFVDQASHAIRRMGFRSPRGWHERVYDDFVWLKAPGWLQARRVTLYYDGVKANEVVWERTRVNAPIDDALFAPPGAPEAGHAR
jgi:hypothetical protein